MINLLTDTFWGLFQRPFRFREICHQLYFVANRSLPIVLICASAAAIVTILESSFHMKLVIQNDSLVPGFAAVLILRELAAIITALLLCSRVGAGYAAEIATMQISEQIDALKMLGIDPINFILIPKLWACILGGVILTVVANISCLISAGLISEISLGYTTSMFISSMNRFVQFRDLIFAMIKGACFGAVIPIVATYFGFNCKAGAAGVGKATTQTVVVASMAIIAIDFILSYSFSYLY